MKRRVDPTRHLTLTEADIKGVFCLWSIGMIGQIDPQMGYAIDKLLQKAIAYGEKQCEKTSNPPTV